MTAVWITIAALAVATALIKASGPVMFGGRELPAVLGRAVPLLAPALLAALVITETFGPARPASPWTRAAGLAAAGAALALRASVVVVIVVAAVVTAGVRALA